MLRVGGEPGWLLCDLDAGVAGGEQLAGIGQLGGAVQPEHLDLAVPAGDIVIAPDGTAAHGERPRNHRHRGQQRQHPLHLRTVPDRPRPSKAPGVDHLDLSVTAPGGRDTTPTERGWGSLSGGGEELHDGGPSSPVLEQEEVTAVEDSQTGVGDALGQHLAVGHRCDPVVATGAHERGARDLR